MRMFLSVGEKCLIDINMDGNGLLSHRTDVIWYTFLPFNVIVLMQPEKTICRSLRLVQACLLFGFSVGFLSVWICCANHLDIWTSRLPRYSSKQQNFIMHLFLIQKKSKNLLNWAATAMGKPSSSRLSQSSSSAVLLSSDFVVWTLQHSL